MSKLMMLPISFRGRGRRSPSIRGSAAYRTRRVCPYDIAGKSLQRRGQTLKPDSRPHLLRRILASTHTLRSSIVGKRDRGTRGLVSRGFLYGRPSTPIKYLIFLHVLSRV